jgi:hypothetical protein
MRQAGEITVTVRRVARDIRLVRRAVSRRPLLRIRRFRALLLATARAPGAMRAMHPAEFSFLRSLRLVAAKTRETADGAAAHYDTRLSLSLACHWASQEADTSPVRIPAPLGTPAGVLVGGRRMTLPESGTISARHALLPQLAGMVVRPAESKAAKPQQNSPTATVLARAMEPPAVAMTVRRPVAEPTPTPLAPRRIEPPAPDARMVRAMALAPDVIRAVSDQVVHAIDRRMLARREQFGRN